jgi:simple sugar transport system ATP-binding protein
LSPIPPAVELRGLTKRFGSLVANDGIDLRVRTGVIHAIVGENGAGKSTAMKLLYGMLRPDAGEILLNGERCEWRSPREAIACGIGMVHQHFMLAGPFTALDNILLGAEPRRFGMIDRTAARRRLEGLARQYGLEVDLDAPVERLPVGVQQRIEILKLIFRDARVLILDEPTSVLTPQETRALFGQLARLRDEGKTILLITHKLGEVMDFTQHVTVFRCGRVTGDLPTAAASPQALAELMVGRSVNLRLQFPAARPHEEVALEVADLTLGGSHGAPARLHQVSLRVRHGEVVGIAGVEGNGQTALLSAVLDPARAGRLGEGKIRMLGRDVTHWTARRIRSLGVAVIPEDRQAQGLLLGQPLRENFLLGGQRRPEFSRGGWLRLARLSAAAGRALVEQDVRPADLEIQARGLSGGNQQKLILARELHAAPPLIIAAQPTRGVDVGAIEFIQQRIIAARDAGAGVLLVSSELEEILTLADRVLVMYRGRIAAEFDGKRVSESELGLKMGGG